MSCEPAQHRRQVGTRLHDQLMLSSGISVLVEGELAANAAAWGGDINQKTAPVLIIRTTALAW